MGKRDGFGFVVLHGPRSKGMRAAGKQGPPVKCAWLREALYEWWCSLRYSVDWGKVAGNAQPQWRQRKIARFTRDVIMAKAKQLMSDYVSESMLAGKAAQAVDLRPRWFAAWQKEYGLSMRRPNRKYKAPKWVVAERLGIGWLNVAPGESIVPSSAWVRPAH